MVMFTVLLAGIYTAYKQFSGLDPLKLDPKAVVRNLEGILPQLNIEKLAIKKDDKVLGQQSNNQTVDKKPVFKFLLVADSHNDNKNLAQAISQAKAQFADLEFIIGLGDYTEVGTIEELKSVKKVFDESSLRYFLIPGDHDLWDCRNRSVAPTACFKQVFGPNYQTFTLNNFKFLLLDNSDNYNVFVSVAD